MKKSLLYGAAFAGCLALSVPAVSFANVPNGPNGNGGNTNINTAVASATNTTVVQVKNIIKLNSGKNHFKPSKRNNFKKGGKNFNGGMGYNGKHGKKGKNENNNNHAVPEPGTMALLAAAVGAIVIRKRQTAN
jgi:hypothetical protein